MILAFKPQFKEKILSGVKIHTIREDSLRRWKQGKIIHFATGVRTKDYNQFKEGECVSCQRVFMTYAHGDLIEISINDRYLSFYHEREQLAINDGFESWEHFFNWFYPLIEKSPDKCFSGRIIHWTNFRY